MTDIPLIITIMKDELMQPLILEYNKTCKQT